MMIKMLSVAALGVLATAAHDPLPTLELGAKLPAAGQKMMDVSGKEVSLQEIAGGNGLLVVFTCNTCPFVIGRGAENVGWEGRMPELAAIAKRFSIGVAQINSNETKRGEGDGFEDMKTRYAEKNLGGHYLLDKGHVVADAFGARTTPHVFLFNKNMELVYKGAIDDNHADPAQVKEPWLKNAMVNLNNGQPIDPATTRNIGCSVKRAEHKH
ncbi:MAG: redoxin family protein [Flavobacteriales bacterium]|nr:redoxin family protein [Flavobacteriales bacterium]